MVRFDWLVAIALGLVEGFALVGSPMIQRGFGASNVGNYLFLSLYAVGLIGIWKGNRWAYFAFGGLYALVSLGAMMTFGHERTPHERTAQFLFLAAALYLGYRLYTWPVVEKAVAEDRPVSSTDWPLIDKSVAVLLGLFTLSEYFTSGTPSLTNPVLWIGLGASLIYGSCLVGVFLRKKGFFWAIAAWNLLNGAGIATMLFFRSIDAPHAPLSIAVYAGSGLYLFWRAWTSSGQQGEHGVNANHRPG